MEKGLHIVPANNIINEENLRTDFGKFKRKLRDRWYFRDESSNWKPPPGYSCVELFLSKLESELLSFLPGKPQAYNLIRNEWLAKPSLAED